MKLSIEAPRDRARKYLAGLSKDVLLDRLVDLENYSLNLEMKIERLEQQLAGCKAAYASAHKHEIELMQEIQRLRDAFTSYHKAACIRIGYADRFQAKAELSKMYQATIKE